MALRLVTGIYGIVLVIGGTLSGSKVLFAQAADRSPAASARLTELKRFVSEFVEITPGKGKFPKSFEMGSANGASSEKPVHKVEFSYDFEMARYEVTQQLYKTVMGENPSVWGGPRNSVEMVTFRDAEQFCQRMTQLLHDAELIAANEEIRLPTEAEWEYCCRAGTTTAYSFGENAQREGDTGKLARRLDEFGWHTGNAAGNDPPVGALKPNAWGLYDMHGYLWEYVSDSWQRDYADAPADGGSVDPGNRQAQRVMRGGSWRDHFTLLRSAARQPIPDHTRSDAIGFRCVKATTK